MQYIKTRNSRRKKKIQVILIFSLLMLLFMTSSCSYPTFSGVSNEKIGVIVSILPQAEFAERVGKDKIDVTVMVPPGASPHTHEPTPGQLREVSSAEIYAKVGSGVEFELAWMDKITEMNSDMHIIDCSHGIDYGSDPHIWLSIKNAGAMVENIYEGLLKIDPENRDFYFNNKNAFQAELAALDARINEILKGKKNRKILVFHPAWTYFADDYDIEQIPIEDEGKEPTISGMEKLIEQAKEHNIKVIFASPEFSTRSAEVIAGELGGSVVLVSPLAKDYLNNMEAVASAFAESMQ